MATQTGLLTVEEFLKLPPAKEGHYELHHGEVVRVPPPKWNHEFIQGFLTKAFIKMAGDGWEIRMEMSFQPGQEYEVWRADIGCVRVERAPDRHSYEYLKGAPDIVVEVLSPGNTIDEINDKMAVCLANGCQMFIVVDPKRNRVPVTEGDVTRHYAAGDVIPLPLLGGEIQVSAIFGV